MSYVVLDLYAGTGRCAEPFRAWEKVSDIFLADNSDYARDVYLANHPNSKYLKTNLATISASKLLTEVGGRVDILLGCPPCQGYSDCGAKESADPRNNHVSRFKNLVAATRPMAVVMENVPLAAESAKFGAMTAELDRLGYTWASTVTNAALWGSCQTRQRLIVVAFRKDVGAQPIFPTPTHGGHRNYFCYSTLRERPILDDPATMLGHAPGAMRSGNFYAPNGEVTLGELPIPTLGEVIGDLPTVGCEAADKLGHKRWKHVNRTLRRMKQIREGERWSGGRDHFSQTYGRLHRQGLARTITGYFANGGSGRFWHPTENRALSLREAARIQGFSDTFKFSNNDTNNGILVGNALDAALAKMAFETVKLALS